MKMPNAIPPVRLSTEFILETDPIHQDLFLLDSPMEQVHTKTWPWISALTIMSRY